MLKLHFDFWGFPHQRSSYICSFFFISCKCCYFWHDNKSLETFFFVKAPYGMIWHFILIFLQIHNKPLQHVTFDIHFFVWVFPLLYQWIQRWFFPKNEVSRAIPPDISSISLSAFLMVLSNCLHCILYYACLSFLTPSLHELNVGSGWLWSHISIGLVASCVTVTAFCTFQWHQCVWVLHH